MVRGLDLPGGLVAPVTPGGGLMWVKRTSVEILLTAVSCIDFAVIEGSVIGLVRPGNLQ